MSLFFGARATVYTGDTIATVSTTQDLVTAHSGSLTDYSGEVTELRISDGEADTDALNVFGSQEVDESRPSLKTAEFSLVMTDAATTGGVSPLEFFSTSSQTASAVSGTATGEDSGTFNRWNFADPTGNRAKKAILFKVTDGTNTTHILMNDAYFTTTGEVTQTADGHTELSMTAKCLISDYYSEDNI